MDESSENRWWWETATPGERIPLAFVKLDRVGSTGEWEELPEQTVLERRARYTDRSWKRKSACCRFR